MTEKNDWVLYNVKRTCMCEISEYFVAFKRAENIMGLHRRNI